MKKYEDLDISVITFAVEDVITESPHIDEDEGPLMPVPGANT